MKSLRLETCIGAMRVILNQGIIDAASAMNVTEQNLKLISRNTLWQNNEKHVVMRTLQSLMSGTLDHLGLTGFPISAEYIAAALCVWVHPCNLQIACAWFGKHLSNHDLANFQNQPMELLDMEKAKPEKIFALCIDILSDSPIDELVMKFEKDTGRVLGHVYENKLQTSKPKKNV
jgi:hypothetical protein